MQSKAHVFGVVLNRLKPAHSGYYAHYYYSSYDKTYEQDIRKRRSTKTQGKLLGWIGNLGRR
jgi:hypothetical protein